MENELQEYWHRVIRESPALEEVELVKFHEPGIYNYSVLLLSEDQRTLYVGAREAIFAVSALNISEKEHEVDWKVSEETRAK
ncbi:semaphorin-4D-like [Thomomys bottae]